ncbi:MAG: hypothetical protein ACKVRO_04920 [Micropepsaceae bacterium]
MTGRSNPPAVGEVIPYWFLWHSEHEAGEESGRKLRPCVVVIALKTDDDKTRISVLPITHVPPNPTRRAVEVPARVKATLGLDDGRSWIVCDEFNEFEWPGFDIGKTPDGFAAFGRLPLGLLNAVRAEVVAARKAGAHKAVPRDD